MSLYSTISVLATELQLCDTVKDVAQIYARSMKACNEDTTKIALTLISLAMKILYDQREARPHAIKIFRRLKTLNENLAVWELKIGKLLDWKLVLDPTEGFIDLSSDEVIDLTHIDDVV